MPLVEEGFAASLTEAATRFAVSHPAMGNGQLHCRSVAALAPWGRFPTAQKDWINRHGGLTSKPRNDWVGMGGTTSWQARRKSDCAADYGPQESKERRDHRFFGASFTAGWSNTPRVTTPP